VQYGNNVSHANNKTRRRFLPNLQKTSMFSQALARPVRIRLTPHAIRTVEQKGGLDAFLLDARDAELAPAILKLKKRIKKAITRQTA
jgi:large subunit ribosomal protein L28